MVQRQESQHQIYLNGHLEVRSERLQREIINLIIAVMMVLLGYCIKGKGSREEDIEIILERKHLISMEFETGRNIPVLDICRFTGLPLDAQVCTSSFCYNLHEVEQTFQCSVDKTFGFLLIIVPRD